MSWQEEEEGERRRRSASKREIEKIFFYSLKRAAATTIFTSTDWLWKKDAHVFLCVHNILNCARRVNKKKLCILNTKKQGLVPTTGIHSYSYRTVGSCYIILIFLPFIIPTRFVFLQYIFTSGLTMDCGIKFEQLSWIYTHSYQTTIYTYANYKGNVTLKN